ncbi:MAG: hypothetical protein AB7T06_18810 [Kofleriaceae bacterium]
MRVVILVVVALAACGKKTESSSEKPGSAEDTPKPATERFAKVKQPKVSKLCERARDYFGYGAECIETPMPELTSAAGTITRVMKKGDPTGEWAYVYTKADGSMYVGSGGGNSRVLDEVLKDLDVKATPPELLAKLATALDDDVAIVRCLPGTNDTLADKDGKPLPCRAPAITKNGDKTILTYTMETFAHPRLGRDAHRIAFETMEVTDHDLSSIEGDYLVELPADAPLPKDMPPPPTMTSPPEWFAKPVAAPDDVNKALCALAVDRVAHMKGRQCKAYAYPSLDSPAGSVFYLANDAGQRHVIGLRKPDGSMFVGFDVSATENPMIPIVKSWDPTTMPAEKLVRLHLFLGGEAARILCLPGSNDVIPDSRCEPPKAEKKGEALVLTYIVEELPFPDEHGNVSDPAVRSYTTELTPGGGSSGGGFRLVDMRDE